MRVIVSQITGNSTVCSKACSGEQQKQDFNEGNRRWFASQMANIQESVPMLSRRLVSATIWLFTPQM